MTKYSREPPRKDLVLHLTFDDVDEDGDPLDLSPQGNRVPLSGQFDTVAGKVGVGVKAVKNSSSIGPVTVGTQDTFSVSFWVRPEWFDRDPNVNEFKELVSSTGGQFIILEQPGKVSFRVPGMTSPVKMLSTTTLPLDEWTHVACVYDGTDKFIYINGQEDARDAAPEPGTAATLGDLTFLEKDSADTAMDDVRVYRAVRPPSDIQGLYEIGAEHGQLDNLADAWDNAGIPFRVGAGNANLAGTLGEAHDYNFRQLDTVRDSTHIDSSSGLELERKGRGHGILRKTGENDATYRARIKAVLASGRSRGTFGDILQATATVVETSTDRVELDVSYDSHPATVFIFVQQDDLDASNLNQDEIENILGDVVPGGHAVQVRASGSPAFRVIADGDVNDPEEGLTSDAITTGGRLASDVP